jgi:predicted ATPase
MCLGELDLAAEDVRKAIELYDPARHTRLAMSYGVDIRVAALCFQGEISWLKGNVDRARLSVAMALEEAKAAKHLNSVSMSLFFCGLVSFLYRDDSAARAYMDELMHLAKGQSIGAWPILGRAMLGWANMACGGAEEGVTRMCEGVSSARKLGVSMFMPIFLCRIADVMLAQERISEAERYVEDAEALVSRTGEVNYLGELYRLKAELHRLRSEFEMAGALYSDGLEVARKQNAKSVELRVATSFSQFLENQHEVKRGIDILKPIHLWFQEGHSSPDFVAAQNCIERLSRAAVQ